MIRQLRLQRNMRPGDPQQTRREELEILAQEREALRAGIAWVREELRCAPTPELSQVLIDLRCQMAALAQAVMGLIAAPQPHDDRADGDPDPQ